MVNFHNKTLTCVLLNLLYHWMVVIVIKARNFNLICRQLEILIFYFVLQYYLMKSWKVSVTRDNINLNVICKSIMF